jgi:hypothetical protein
MQPGNDHEEPLSTTARRALLILAGFADAGQEEREELIRTNAMELFTHGLITTQKESPRRLVYRLTATGSKVAQDQIRAGSSPPGLARHAHRDPCWPFPIRVK